MSDMILADDLHCLKLHLEWGADEALGDEAVDRLASGPTAPALARVAEEPGRDRPSQDRVSRRPASGPIPARSSTAAALQLAHDAGTVASLEAAVAGFTLCALRDTAGALAFGDGPSDAATVMVIDAPSADDDATGVPLSGALGAFLDQVLASVGIKRSAIRIATLVPWRPPGDRPANAAENACCLPFLLAHLRLVRPSTILVAGAAAARALTGGTGSTRALLGTFRPIAIEGLPNPVPALFLPAPAQLRAEPRDRKLTWEALLSFAHRLDDTTPSTITTP